MTSQSIALTLKENGKLEYDDTTRRELLNEWEESTMAKVGIKFTPKCDLGVARVC